MPVGLSYVGMMLVGLSCVVLADLSRQRQALVDRALIL